MRMQRRKALMGAVAFIAGGALGVRALAQGPRVIPVVARKFVFLPGEIRVKKGETVTLELTAPEVVMGLNIPDFKVRTDIIPGTTSRLTFTPDKAGTFTFLCDIFCGDGHEGMSGTLIVT
jgi:cytochrome c oxidase subunit 2